MLKYKILIKPFVLSCVLIRHVNGDTIQAEVVVVVVVVVCLIHFHFIPSDVGFQHSAPTFTLSHLMLDFSTGHPLSLYPV
jgi:hypothetical protein